MRTGRLILLVFIALAASAVGAFAQTRSMMTGAIRDSSGAVLPGSTVTLTGPSLLGGPKTAVTNEDGVYRLPELSPGTYPRSAQVGLKVAF